MHAPSALLAGAVLTFGVAALTNLYLPPAWGPNPTSIPAASAAPQSLPIDAAYDTAPFAETLAAAGRSAEAFTFDGYSADLPDADAPAADASMPESQMAAVGAFPTAPQVASAAANVEATGAPSAANSSATAPATAKAATGSSASPATARATSAKPSAADTTQTARTERSPPTKAASRRESGTTTKPAAIEPVVPSNARAKEVFANNAPSEEPIFSVPLAPSTPARPLASAAPLSLSAIAGGRAWVRVGDTRTVAIKTGDILPNVGRVTSVTDSTVTFDNGTVLRLEP